MAHRVPSLAKSERTRPRAGRRHNRNLCFLAASISSRFCGRSPLQELTGLDCATSSFASVLQLYQSNFASSDEYSLSEITRRVQTGMYRLFVLNMNDPQFGGVAGFILTAAYGKKKRVVNIEYLAIASQTQGRGLGLLLLRFLLPLLAESEHRLLTLECLSKLVPFYHKIGAVDAQLPAPRCFAQPYNFMAIPLQSDTSVPSRGVLSMIRKRLRREVHTKEKTL